MRVYGFATSDVPQGELQAAEVSKTMFEEYGADFIAGELDWDSAFSSFEKARKTLLIEMRENDVEDPELYRIVRSYKASFIPVNKI